MFNNLNLSRVGTLYAFSREEFIGGNDSSVTFDLDDKLNEEAFLSAYRAALEKYPETCAQWRYDDVLKKHRWFAASKEDIEKFYKLQEKAIYSYVSWEEAKSTSYKANESANIIFFRVDDKTIHFSFKHHSGNARNSLSWSACVFEFYENRLNENFKDEDDELGRNRIAYLKSQNSDLNAIPYDFNMEWMKLVKGGYFLWSYFRNLKRLKKNYTTIDFARSKPTKDQGFVARTLIFSESQSKAIIDRANQSEDAALTYFIKMTTRACFNLSPKDEAVWMALAVDLKGILRIRNDLALGNPTANLQLVLPKLSENELDTELKRQYVNFERRVPLFYSIVASYLDRLLPEEYFVRRFILKPTKKINSGGSKYLTCILTYIKNNNRKYEIDFAHRPHGHVKTQTLSIVILWYKKSLSVEICGMRSRFDPKTIESLLEEMKRLISLDLPDDAIKDEELHLNGLRGA